jgi:hypothetical protein
MMVVVVHCSPWLVVVRRNFKKFASEIPFQGIQTSDQDFGQRDLENRGR